MESLESKLARLPPDQRREVEDFVDFLIQRAEGIRITVQLAHDPPNPLKSVAPPLIAVDTSSGESAVHEIANTSTISDTVHSVESRSQSMESEVTGGGETSDGYFDYGKFERSDQHQTSGPYPADIAVQNVKRKIDQKGQEESKNKLLDWID